MPSQAVSLTASTSPGHQAGAPPTPVTCVEHGRHRPGQRLHRGRRRRRPGLQSNPAGSVASSRRAGTQLQRPSCTSRRCRPTRTRARARSATDRPRAPAATPSAPPTRDSSMTRAATRSRQRHRALDVDQRRVPRAWPSTRAALQRDRDDTDAGLKVATLGHGQRQPHGRRHGHLPGEQRRRHLSLARRSDASTCSGDLHADRRGRQHTDQRHQRRGLERAPTPRARIGHHQRHRAHDVDGAQLRSAAGASGQTVTCTATVTDTDA